MAKRPGPNLAITPEDLRRSCTGKVYFGARNQARDVAARRSDETKRLTPYKCLHCKGWHLTSREPEDLKKIRQAIRLRGGKC
jgi:hypothetical protein